MDNKKVKNIRSQFGNNIKLCNYRKSADSHFGFWFRLKAHYIKGEQNTGKKNCVKRRIWNLEKAKGIWTVLHLHCQWPRISKEHHSWQCRKNQEEEVTDDYLLGSVGRVKVDRKQRVCTRPDSGKLTVSERSEHYCHLPNLTLLISFQWH